VWFPIDPGRRATSRRAGRWARPAAALGIVAVAVLTVSGCGWPGRLTAGSGETAGSPSSTSSTSPGSSGSSGSSGSGSATTTDESRDDPAVFSTQVKASAGRAGIAPQLLMAILYNESYKPHDAAFEREWHSLEPDSAFGVANMHEKAFDDTKRGRSFAARRWEELPDDPALAIEAAAWYLHDLAVRLPQHWKAAYTHDELLALGYDAGPGNMLAFARGGPLLPAARTYLQKLHENWGTAATALQHG
jgi:hypothetical protein